MFELPVDFMPGISEEEKTLFRVLHRQACPSKMSFVINDLGTLTFPATYHSSIPDMRDDYTKQAVDRNEDICYDSRIKWINQTYYADELMINPLGQVDFHFELTLFASYCSDAWDYLRVWEDCGIGDDGQAGFFYYLKAFSSGDEIPISKVKLPGKLAMIVLPLVHSIDVSELEIGYFSDVTNDGDTTRVEISGSMNPCEAMQHPYEWLGNIAAEINRLLEGLGTVGHYYSFQI